MSTLLGRRRYLPGHQQQEPNSAENAERQAINMPIQGTAADMIKIAMIRIDAISGKETQEQDAPPGARRARLRGPARREEKAMTTLVKERMQGAMDLTVPVKVDIGAGNNWLEAH